MGKSLDKDKPHGEIHGGESAPGERVGKFVQDGQVFDNEGEHMGTHDGELPAKATKPAAK